MQCNARLTVKNTIYYTEYFEFINRLRNMSGNMTDKKKSQVQKFSATIPLKIGQLIVKN